MTVGLIAVGGIVRVSDSGLGCGNHWPLCNGTIIPPLDNLNAWIEWSHRLFAMLIGVFGLLSLVTAIIAYRKTRRAVISITALAALLFTLQSALGAIVVILDLPPTSVTLHLGTAMFLLASLIWATVAATYTPTRAYARDNFSFLLYVTTALSFVIILTGALVRGSGATLACVDWPLCNGALFPTGQGQLAVIHMLHRVAVLALGITLVMLVVSALRNRPAGRMRTLAVLAFVGYLTQAGIGAMLVLSGAAPLWGAGHVLFAALTWGLLVTLTILETINSRAAHGETDATWHAQSALN